MKVKDTLNTNIYNYYGENGGSPIYDIKPYLENECFVEIYEDDDGEDEYGRAVILKQKLCYIKGVK